MNNIIPHSAPRTASSTSSALYGKFQDKYQEKVSRLRFFFYSLHKNIQHQGEKYKCSFFLPLQHIFTHFNNTFVLTQAMEEKEDTKK